MQRFHLHYRPIWSRNRTYFRIKIRAWGVIYLKKKKKQRSKILWQCPFTLANMHAKTRRKANSNKYPGRVWPSVQVAWRKGKWCCAGCWLPPPPPHHTASVWPHRDINPSTHKRFARITFMYRLPILKDHLVVCGVWGRLCVDYVLHNLSFFQFRMYCMCTLYVTYQCYLIPLIQ
jgi:hypothetical protein